MVSRLAQRLTRTCFATGCLLLSLTPIASASHFRGTTINWSRPDSASRTVTFEIQSVLRADYYPGIIPSVGTVIKAAEETFYFGDNTSAHPIYTVESIYPVPNYLGFMSVRATFVHTYATADSFQARLRDSGRVASMMNNNNTVADVFADVTTSPTKATASPRAVLPPMVVAPNVPNTSFFLPVAPGSNTAGDSIHVSLTTKRDVAGATFVSAPGAAVSISNGLVQYSFNPTSSGLYNYSLSVTQNGARTPIEGIVTVRALSSVGPAAPLLTPVTADAPASMTHIEAYPNLPLTVPFTGSTSSSYYTSWRAVYGGLPPGSSYSAGAAPFTTEFHWTPAAAQLGQSYPMFFASEAAKVATTTLYGDDSAHFILDVVTPVVEVGDTKPSRAFVLDHGSPTPTSGPATLSFTLGTSTRTSLDVLDVTGRRVRTALPAALRSAGRYAVVWNGRDDDGVMTAPGVYVVRLSTPAGTASTRLVRIR